MSKNKGFMDTQLPSVFDIIDNLSLDWFWKTKGCSIYSELCKDKCTGKCKSKKKTAKKTAKKKKKT